MAFVPEPFSTSARLFEFDGTVLAHMNLWGWCLVGTTAFGECTMNHPVIWRRCSMHEKYLSHWRQRILTFHHGRRDSEFIDRKRLCGHKSKALRALGMASKRDAFVDRTNGA